MTGCRSEQSNKGCGHSTLNAYEKGIHVKLTIPILCKSTLLSPVKALLSHRHHILWVHFEQVHKRMCCLLRVFATFAPADFRTRSLYYLPLSSGNVVLKFHYCRHRQRIMHTLHICIIALISKKDAIKTCLHLSNE